MIDTLSRPLVVRDGRRTRELRTFTDVQAFLAPAQGRSACGITRTLMKAETTAQKKEALKAFQEWARKTGVLE